MARIVASLTGAGGEPGGILLTLDVGRKTRALLRQLGHVMTASAGRSPAHVDEMTQADRRAGMDRSFIIMTPTLFISLAL